jgi:hypothetical protein
VTSTQNYIKKSINIKKKNMIVRGLQLIYKISIKINAYDRFDDATNGHFPSKFQLSVFFVVV